MTNPKNPPLSACVLVERNGLFLSVSRRHDETLPGFPGGKLEPGESPILAAARECREETGSAPVTLVAAPLYEGDDGHGFYCYCYLAPDGVWGEPADQGEGKVAWVTREALEASYFGEFNRAALMAWSTYHLIHRLDERKRT